MNLENTLIKNYIDELKSLRVKNYELTEKLSERDGESQLLKSRLTNVKAKYNRVKEERNKAWQKIKDVVRSNQLLDSQLYKLKLQIDNLKEMENAELLKLNKDNDELKAKIQREKRSFLNLTQSKQALLERYQSSSSQDKSTKSSLTLLK